MIVRSSQHSMKFANTDKKNRYAKFLQEYRRVAQLYIDHIWENGYSFLDEETGYECIFDPKQDKWNLPEFLDYNKFQSIETQLSARAKSSLVTQLRGMIDSATEKYKARCYIRDSKIAEGQTVSKKLLEKIEKYPPAKPNTSNINPELSSKCAKFHEITSPLFEGILVLQYLGDVFGKISVPLKGTKVADKWKGKENAKRLGSFLLMDQVANIRWQLNTKPKKGKRKVGADQGKNTVLTLSDGQSTPLGCKHGHTLDSILDKLRYKRKGSDAFRKAQAHRENFVNWSINQLNFGSMDILALESIWNINYRRRTSRKMSHWCNTLIRDKCIARCEETGVRMKSQSSTYRSQRCHQCGLVLGSNRSGKIYSCESCGYVGDADFNAAKNHEVELPDVPKWIRDGKFNRTGFFWMEAGFFERNGEERGVPLCPNEVNESQS